MIAPFCTVVALLAAGLSAAGAPAPKESPVAAPQRVGEIAAMLAARPAGFGQPITDRAAWKRLAAHPSYSSLLRRAETLRKQPIPLSPDDLYLEFVKTGNRSRWQRVAGERRGRIGYLTLAECLESKGRFLPALEESIAAVCAERTWVMPAHDAALRNLKGQQIDIDLGAAHLAWDLATAGYLLGDRLGAKTRKLLHDNLRRRIFDPYLDMVSGKRPANWWTHGTNNWNAVCLAGVTGSALAAIQSPQERATFVAAAETYSLNFLKGFTPDGYCSEGLGYWGYGFGYYVLLAEAIWQATGGGVDLMARPQVRAPATYAERIEILNGVYPAFADCSVTARPSERLVHFLRRRLGLGAEAADDGKLIAAGSSLGPAMMYSFPNSATKAPPSRPAETAAAVRTYFEHAGVLLCRPAQGSTCRMGVALKGGHNGEHHNHNDVGSYVVAVGERAVLLDPGAEVYTARTFSNRRYDSKVLNSYGHPVPVVAGKLQRTGRQAAAKVMRTSFTDEADTFVLDLRAAYGLKETSKLLRTFVYSRRGAGALSVTDEVVFTEPREFETALITLGKWRRLDPLTSAAQGRASLLIYDFDEAVRVDVTVTGAAAEVRAEQIREDVRTRSLPMRLGIRLKEPVAAASVVMRIIPAGHPLEADTGSLLRNGGFEAEDWCWNIPAGGGASLSTEQAADGKRSLKIADASREKGSDVASARIRTAGGQGYVLRGKAFGASGDRGVGIYVRFLDKDDNLLNAVDAFGGMRPLGLVGGSDRKWQPFAFGFRTPGGTAAMQVWIHSTSTARLVAYLDELEIVKADGKQDR